MCSQVIAPIKNEAGEVCMYILNFEDTDAGPEVPTSAEPSTTVRFSKCNAHLSSNSLFYSPIYAATLCLFCFPLVLALVMSVELILFIPATVMVF